jgi:hypothetical protein
MNTPASLLMLLLAAALTPACEKNAVQDIADPPVGARIKFFNFGVGAPGVNFYANDTKMTAISSTSCTVITDANRELCTTTGSESTNGVNYGGAGAGGFYSVIAPGQYVLRGTIAAATDKDLPISSLAVTIAPDRYYSFYQSGIYDAATKTVDAFIVEDPFTENVDYSVAYVRFVNAISNADAMTLYATDGTAGTEVAAGAAVSYRSTGAFTLLPGGVYDLSTRYAGSGTNVISRTAVSFGAGRVYTIAARGDITDASTILLDNTANR